MERVEYILEVEKVVEENRLCTVSYAGRLPEGAAITAQEVTGYDLFRRATDNTVISGTALDGETITCLLIAGVAGKRYRIEFKATLDDGSILYDYVLLVVVAKPT